MASDGEPTDAAFSEAIRGSQETIANAIAGDLETRYVSLKKEKDSLEQDKLQQDARIVELLSQTKTLEETLLKQGDELATEKREKNTLQQEISNTVAEEKSQKERMNRMEAEADGLREEIR